MNPGDSVLRVYINSSKIEWSDNVKEPFYAYMEKKSQIKTIRVIVIGSQSTKTIHAMIRAADPVPQWQCSYLPSAMRVSC